MQKNKRRSVILMIAAISIAVVAALIFYGRLSALEREIGDKVYVVVATQNIEAATRLITEGAGQNVELELYPKKYAELHGLNYLLSLEDIGDSTVALVDFRVGDIILRSGIDENAGLEPNMRAVALAVDRVQGAGGSIRPGNRVDIIASYKRGADQEPVTEILFQDVKVLAVSHLASDIAPPPPAEGAAPAGETQPPARFLPTGELMDEATLTLALTLEDALKLAYMDNFGVDVRLVIRRLDEEPEPALPSVTEDSF